MVEHAILYCHAQLCFPLAQKLDRILHHCDPFCTPCCACTVHPVDMVLDWWVVCGCIQIKTNQYCCACQYGRTQKESGVTANRLSEREREGENTSDGVAWIILSVSKQASHQSPLVHSSRWRVVTSQTQTPPTTFQTDSCPASAWSSPQ